MCLCKISTLLKSLHRYLLADIDVVRFRFYLPIEFELLGSFSPAGLFINAELQESATSVPCSETLL